MRTSSNWVAVSRLQLEALHPYLQAEAEETAVLIGQLLRWQFYVSHWLLLTLLVPSGAFYYKTICKLYYYEFFFSTFGRCFSVFFQTTSSLIIAHV